MATAKRKFASQLEPSLLSELKLIANEEGRLFQTVLEDAVRLYIEHKRTAKPREVVLAHFRASLDKNRRLGELLAQ